MKPLLRIAALLALFALGAHAQDEPHGVALKYATFDPATQTPGIPRVLEGGDDVNLWIVQFERTPTDAHRALVLETGGELLSYLPENAYVARLQPGAARSLEARPMVRSVTSYHPAFRLDEALRTALLTGRLATQRYHVVVADKHRDKPALFERVRAIDGEVDGENPGSLLCEVSLSPAQLLQALRFDEVLWIDVWGAPEDDMDNARIQGGANYLESVAGYTGQGIVGHQMEGLNPTHVDWNLPPIGWPAGCTAVESHGHNTAGIVYGNGTSHPTARGMAPNAQCVYTSCRTNRYANFQSLIANHRILFTTASWGSPRTRQYTSVSAEADDICFDQDIIWTNSQSNAGNQDSRAEAWAKNVYACGGVAHRNNPDPSDDSWAAGGASIGPAADGRTKPDFCAYYDNIATSSSNGSYTPSFGGTSGATPIVAGHNALALQMFTDGVFGNTLRNPGGSRFSNKPRFPTLKALQMVCANPYPFTAASTDNRREHQGYGFPNLRNMWDDRGVMFLVDEEDVIAQGHGVSYTVAVPAGRSSLKISMSFADPAGNPAAALARINDLTLRVTSPSGTQYWGNAGLLAGVWSTPGGTRDRINTAENVFVQNPQAGNWTVDVVAYLVAQDGHVETPAVDADFGLAVRGATFVSKRPIQVVTGSVTPFGQGCLGTGTTPSTCSSLNGNGGTLTRETRAWEYAAQATASTALSVTGFELFTASVSGGTITQPAALYLGTASGPTDPPLATTTMTIGGAEAFYAATFASPVAIPAGAFFYLALTHADASYIATLTSGTSGPGYYRSSTGAWLSSGVLTEPAYRVRCAGGAQNAVPRLAIDGVPEVGQSIDLTLALAAPNRPAAFALGLSNTTFGTLTLPFDLGTIGAPTCFLYVSGDIPLPVGTNATGAASLRLPIGVDPAVVGATVYVQGLVSDPGANSLGMAVTGAATVVFGG